MRFSIWRMQSLPRETDEQMTSRILGYASNTWWRFLDAAAAHDARRAVRIAVARRPGAGKTPSQKASWFGTLRNVAITPGTVELAAAGVGEKGNGQPACRSPKPITRRSRSSSRCGRSTAGTTILKTQLARIENPDRKARFQFVMPALSADAGRARDMVPVAARRQQPPARTVGPRGPQLPASSAARRGLEEIRAAEPRDAVGDPEDRRYFLPEALARRHARRPLRRKDVADTVRAFLKNLPANYPERLRNITLQSADELYRAAEIVKR